MLKSLINIYKYKENFGGKSDILNKKFIFEFMNEGQNLAINQMMNFWLYLEHLCFSLSLETPEQKYKQKISEDKKAKIKKILKQNNVEYITTKSLAAATRKMISRYLIGKSKLNDFREDKELTFELIREEFWEEEITKNEDFPELVTKKMKGINLTVGQAYEFYKIIGQDDWSPF